MAHNLAEGTFVRKVGVAIKNETCGRMRENSPKLNAPLGEFARQADDESHLRKLWP